MGSRNFHPTFESAPNEFAARKFRLGECGIVVFHGKKYRMKPVTNDTPVVVGDTVFCNAFGCYGVFQVANIDARRCVVQKGEKQKGINCADVLGVCV